MRKLIAFLLIFLALVGFSLTREKINLITAGTPEQIQDKINQYQSQIDKLRNQAKSLSNQISQFDAQISITSLKIGQTEEKINLLKGRINQLEDSLDSLNIAFSNRAVETYKMVRLGDPVVLILTSKDLDVALSRFHYLQKIQEDDSILFQRLQRAQTVYQDEKVSAEDLRVELETQKKVLDGQKKEKSNLLKVTKNDEKKYQELLAQAKAELAVLLYGLGKETYLRDVSGGEVIGRIIPSASGCSSGQHLHFEVHEGNSVSDPNNYLKATSFTYSYDSNQYSYYGTISPHGSWDWPVDPSIQINQGYGAHGYATTFYAGGVHTGIDIDSSSSSSVKAVKPGKLYAGTYQCGGIYAGTLTYAKVDQGNGVTVWYLHIIPQ